MKNFFLLILLSSCAVNAERNELTITYPDLKNLSYQEFKLYLEENNDYKKYPKLD